MNFKVRLLKNVVTKFLHKEIKPFRVIFFRGLVWTNYTLNPNDEKFMT